MADPCSHKATPMSDDRAPKIIDAKLPLTWLLGTACAIIMSFGLLYGNVDRLVKDVGELQLTVKQGNVQTAALQGTISVLQYRIETLERNLRPQDQPRSR